MKKIIQRFATKIQINNSKIFFIYNGNIINEELNDNKIINKEDKKRNEMNILVNEKNFSIAEENIIKSKEIICPECKENIFINIKDYKINLFNCKNKHNINNILLQNYEKTQNIDISKIICDKCKIKNKSKTYNNEFFKCNTCNINLCPLCKSTHDKNHNIINYEKRNFICDKHNEDYIKFCNKCNENICIRCEIEHENHAIINYEDILSNDNIINIINKFKKYFEILKKDINDIIIKFNNIINNIVLYHNISNNYINNNENENENKNYKLLKNRKEFIDYYNNIIKDIEEIINDNKIDNKFKKLMVLYNKMNNNEAEDENKNQINKVIKNKLKDKNYIIKEINVEEDDINRNIRIIN